MSAKEAFRPLPKKNPAKELTLEQTLGYAYGAQIRLGYEGEQVVVESDPHQQAQPWLLEATKPTASACSTSCGCGSVTCT
jgi:hypothetical protein